MKSAIATLLGFALGCSAAPAEDLGPATERTLSVTQIEQVKAAVRQAFTERAVNVDFGEMRAVQYVAAGVVVVCGVTYERRAGNMTRRFPFVGGFEGTKPFEVLELGENPLTGQSIDKQCARQNISAF